MTERKVTIWTSKGGGVPGVIAVGLTFRRAMLLRTAFDNARLEERGGREGRMTSGHTSYRHCRFFFLSSLGWGSLAPETRGQ